MKEENQVNIFTDFKRINETHFWSETRQFWLTSFELQAEFFNQDFLFFDEVRYPFKDLFPPTPIVEIIPLLHCSWPLET